MGDWDQFPKLLRVVPPEMPLSTCGVVEVSDKALGGIALFIGGVIGACEVLPLICHGERACPPAAGAPGRDQYGVVTSSECGRRCELHDEPPEYDAPGNDQCVVCLSSAAGRAEELQDGDPEDRSGWTPLLDCSRDVKAEQSLAKSMSSSSGKG